MKLHDKENLDIASAVSDVLEGNKEVKEISYPHKMYSKDGKDEVEVKNEDEHNEYVKKGYVHEKPEVSESPDEPKAKGEKEFKDKHKVKKSGMNNDGTVTKEDVSEAKKPGRGKITIDIDWIGDKNDTKKAEKAHKIKIKQTGRSTADVTGEKKDLYSFLVGNHYGMDSGDVEDLFKKIFEGVENVRFVVAEAGKEEGYEGEEELSPKQKKYQAFFKKALKKFGVESPQELDKEKRKEFFDYVDKNYDAGDNETD